MQEVRKDVVFSKVGGEIQESTGETWFRVFTGKLSREKDHSLLGLLFLICHSFPRNAHQGSYCNKKVPLLLHIPVGDNDSPCRDALAGRNQKNEGGDV